MRLSRYITQDGTPYATAGGATIAAPYNDMLKVPDGADDTARGTALLATYEEAKLLTPHGNALAADNRATVLIPDGAYRLTETLVLDTDFVDLRAVNVERGGVPEPDDNWDGGNYAGTAMFRPPVTYVYSDLPDVCVVRQTARSTRLTGFGIAQTYGTEGMPYENHPENCAFKYTETSDAANDQSVYDTMYFWNRTLKAQDGTLNSAGTVFAKNVRGTWTNCIDCSHGMRVGVDGNFSANMTDCIVGPYSIGGDASGGSMGPCVLTRCEGMGKMINDDWGMACFGGCVTWGVPSTSDAWFIDCKAGHGSFNIGVNAGGNYIRCIAGDNSFGVTSSIDYVGEFSGYAEDCVIDDTYGYGGALVFGASISTLNVGKLTGELVRCVITECPWDSSWRIEGATITDSQFITYGNRNCIELLDSDSVIKGTTILVTQGGTGYPIYAATPQDVDLSDCVMNNASHDADGLSPNVTNIAANPNNSVTDT